MHPNLAQVAHLPGIATTLCPQLIPQTNDADALEPELWPFKIRLATNTELIDKAAHMRQMAYSRHLPQVADRLAMPEAADFDATSVVLVAESKLDGSPLGTMRIQTNRMQPLPVESAVSLPDHLQGQALAEGLRFGIGTMGPSRLVRDALLKSSYLVCLAWQLDTMIVTARPPLDKLYRSMHFGDVFDGGPAIPMPHIGDIPHSVLFMPTADLLPRWQGKQHPLFNFFFKQPHVDLSDLASLMTAHPLPTASLNKHRVESTVPLD